MTPTAGKDTFVIDLFGASARVSPSVLVVGVGSVVRWELRSPLGPAPDALARITFKEPLAIAFNDDTATVGDPAVGTATTPGTFDHVVSVWPTASGKAISLPSVIIVE